MNSLSRVAPFVAPFFLFMLCLGGEGYFPDQHYLFYPVKALLVAAVLAWYWRELPPLKPASPVVSIALGILGVVLWVGLDPWAMRLNALLAALLDHATSVIGWSSVPEGTNAVAPAGRNPFQLYSPGEAWTLFGLRVAGIALVVPVMEELFWRGFLMRWLIKEDFTAVPLGTFQAFSFGATTVCFASVHGTEWPLALIVGVIYGGWFVRTKSLGSIMLAHGTTNLLLALYCLFSGDWHFLSTVNAVSLPK
jgi:membrane protease YdiL (CAAX protease family)